MRLTYLGIRSFGKLKEKEIILEDGINVIYGSNESGKSTMHAFIRGMLFGMTRYRGRASKTDPYTKYEPWDRPADYAGSMGFRAGEKDFRIERNFYKGDVREKLVCETDGEQLSIPQGDLRMLLGGISESVYDNTVSIGQLRSETDEGMVRELQNHMSNYESSGDGDLDVARAGERLKKKKKEWEVKIRELELKQTQQLEQLEKQIGYARQERQGLQIQLEKVRTEQTEWKKQQTQAERLLEEEKKRQETQNEFSQSSEQETRVKKENGRRSKAAEQSIGMGWKLTVTGMISGVLFLMLAVWNPFSMHAGMRLLSGIPGVLGLGLAVTGSWMIHRTINEREHLRISEQNIERTKAADRKKREIQENETFRDQKQVWEEKEKRLTEIESYVNRLRGREETLLQQIEEKSTMIQNLQENRADLAEKPQEIRSCETEIQSLNLALETLAKLSGGIRRRIGRKLQGRMEEILSEITERKYSRISMDEDMKISLYEWNRQVALHQLSRGTVEQVYLALRMAVSEVLCEEPMPVLLDDVFAMYDEKRLIQTLRWLSKRGGQVLIFTCHRREMELLQHMGIRVNVMELDKI